MSNEAQLYYYDSATGVWRDMWTFYHVAMGDGFLSNLYAPPTMKDYITSDSRLLDGEEYIIDNVHVSSRDVSLTFAVIGTSEADYHSNRDALYALFQQGQFIIRVDYKQSSRSDVFKLVYSKCTSYDQGRSRRAGIVVCKFIEPDPTDRTL